MKNLKRSNNLLVRIGIFLSLCILISLFFSHFSFSKVKSYDNSTVLKTGISKIQFSINGSNLYKYSFEPLEELEVDEDENDGNEDNLIKINLPIIGSLSLSNHSDSNTNFNNQHHKLYIDYCCLRIHII